MLKGKNFVYAWSGILLIAIILLSCCSIYDVPVFTAYDGPRRPPNEEATLKTKGSGGLVPDVSRPIISHIDGIEKMADLYSLLPGSHDVQGICSYYDDYYAKTVFNFFSVTFEAVAGHTYYLKPDLEKTGEDKYFYVYKLSLVVIDDATRKIVGVARVNKKVTSPEANSIHRRVFFIAG